MNCANRPHLGRLQPGVVTLWTSGRGIVRGRWVTIAFDVSGRPDTSAASSGQATVVPCSPEIEAQKGLPGTLPAETWVSPMFSPRGLWLKYCLDTVLVSAAMVLLSPLFLAIAAAVKATSPGPVFFRQQRIGRNGRPFVMLKFRSMRQATDLVRFEPADGLAPGGLEGEDRRTRVGRWLRRSALDEMPQFINVLRQDMSLVGPRPERPHFVERFSRELPDYRLRLRVRPGVTGLAQVRGFRGPTSLRGRVEMDNAYIDSWSLWLDLKISLLTAKAMVGFLLTIAANDELEEVQVMLVGYPQREGSTARDGDADADAGAPGKSNVEPTADGREGQLTMVQDDES